MLDPIAALDTVDTGGRRDDGKEKPQWIDEGMALAPADLFVRIVPVEPLLPWS